MTRRDDLARLNRKTHMQWVQTIAVGNVMERLLRLPWSATVADVVHAAAEPDTSLSRTEFSGTAARPWNDPVHALPWPDAIEADLRRSVAGCATGAEAYACMRKALYLAVSPGSKNLPAAPQERGS